MGIRLSARFPPVVLRVMEIIHRHPAALPDAPPVRAAVAPLVIDPLEKEMNCSGSGSGLGPRMSRIVAA